MDKEKMNLVVSSMISREIDFGETLEDSLKNVYKKIVSLGCGSWNELDILMGGFNLLQELRPHLHCNVEELLKNSGLR